ncbi:DUF3299 domain-containing protein [Maribellus sediminis]|uniref:DUF3299 domain-containing protein n=1 Tax=Maribellus sediminis TaxID=2696285 RepID=UPI0014317FFB|nr:DUF3299 domain-containing protein [Maribellus sediminis]
MRIVFTIIALSLYSLVNAQDCKEILWEDLVRKIEFDDPFTKLSRSQLVKLARVARFRDMKALPNIEITDMEQAKNDSIEKLLEDENVDIDGLLARRHEIELLRQKKVEMVNNRFNQQNVAINGYILPLNLVDEKVSEFLLVPWVGACIHTPPPPKNQIIYLELAEPVKPTKPFQAVTVKGTIATNTKVSDLYLVDGRSPITSGYSMKNADIKLYIN